MGPVDMAREKPVGSRAHRGERRTDGRGTASSMTVKINPMRPLITRSGLKMDDDDAEGRRGTRGRSYQRKET